MFRIVGDYESSLDVTQEVFIKVYNSIHRYSSDYKFSTWLYRIAHNAAIDHLRRNSINPQSLKPKMPTARISRSKPRAARPNKIVRSASGG